VRRAHRRSAVRWIVGGFVAQGVGLALHGLPGIVGIAGFFLGIGAAAALVWGTAHLAHSKGWSPWLGLAGMLSIVGVGLVVLLWEVQRDRKRVDSTKDPP
jgi:hypothetical protein